MRLHVKIGTLPGEHVVRIDRDEEPAVGETVIVQQTGEWNAGKRPLRTRCYRIVNLSSGGDDKLFCLERM